MSKARTLADFISDGSEFADGTISVAEVSGAAPLASPTFSGSVGIAAANPYKTLEIGGDLQLDQTDASIWLKSGATGTEGFVNWTFNTDDTVFAKAGIEYDTRATTGFHLDSGYPISLDASMTPTYGLDIRNGGALIHRITSGTTTFNELGNDHDFRVESSTNTHALFVDAGTSRVGIGTSTLGAELNVYASDVSSYMKFTNVNNTSSGVDIGLYDNGSSSPQAVIINREVGGEIALQDNTGTLLTLSATEAKFNDESRNIDFRVESDGASHMLFVDAANGTLGINNSSPEVIADIGRNSSTGFSNTADQRGQMALTIRNGSEASGRFVGMNLIAGGGAQSDWSINNVWQSNYVGKLAFKTRTGSNSTDWRQLFAMTAGNEAVFNEDSTNFDFRVESDSQSHMLFVDASTNKITIGNNNSQRGTVTITDNKAIVGDWRDKCLLALENDQNLEDAVLTFVGNYSSNNRYGNIIFSPDTSQAASYMVIGGPIQQTGSSRFYGDGSIVFNENSESAYDFRVESDTNSDMFVVDASANCVNIGAVGSTSTNYSLFVRGNNKESGTNTYYVQRIGASGYADTGSYTTLIGLGVEPNASWAKGAIGWTRTGSYDRGHMVFLTNGQSNNSTATIGDERMRITTTGVQVNGSLSKSSGSFRIPHPVASKTETHDLVHSFVEAPQADNIYRGKVDLVAGQATVNIDTVAGMTDGTFALLNREIQCFTSNETGWTAVRGSVSGNTLTIEAQDNTCTDTISWLVIGERQDQHMMDTDWTDENGKVIVEPLKV